VAQMMETIMQVASATEITPLAIGPRDKQLRAARTCYDHLPGCLGVALADALVRSGYTEFASDAGIITEAGVEFLGHVGIDVEPLRSCREKRPTRVLCRSCLDWSERRPHIAGAIGAALCTLSFTQNWIRRLDGTRAVVVTPKGHRIFREQFRVELEIRR
jgi:hypothetical protein